MITINNAYIGQPATSNTTLYTCPVNTQARILKCTVTNDTTTAKTITFHKGGTGDGNLILNARTIGSEETYECPEVVGQVLNAGDIINAIAETVQLTVSLDVMEVT